MLGGVGAGPSNGAGYPIYPPVGRRRSTGVSMLPIDARTNSSFSLSPLDRIWSPTTDNLTAFHS